MVIQHNPTPNKGNSGLDAKNGRGNAYMTPHRDKEHGRIYRVYPKGSEDIEKPDSLIDAISSPDLFWRTTAQRLIVDSGDKSQASALKEIVTKAKPPAAISAFGTLQGLGLLDLETITAALKSSLPRTPPRGSDLRPTGQYLRRYLHQGWKDHRGRSPHPHGAIPRARPPRTFGSHRHRPRRGSPAWNTTRHSSMHGRSPPGKTPPQSSRKLFRDKEEEETAAAPNLLPNPDFSETTDGQADPAGPISVSTPGRMQKNITLSADPTGGRMVPPP